MFDFGINPVEWAESAKTANLDRELVEAFASAGASVLINILWTLPLQSTKAAAVGMYLSLRGFESQGLHLTVKTEMLKPEVLSQYQTEGL